MAGTTLELLLQIYVKKLPAQPVKTMIFNKLTHKNASVSSLFGIQKFLNDLLIFYQLYFYIVWQVRYIC